MGGREAALEQELAEAVRQETEDRRKLAEYRRKLELSEAATRRARAELARVSELGARTAAWQAQGGSLLDDETTDDSLLAIARLLPTARDLFALGLTCPRFAAKVIATAPSVIAGGGAAAPEMLSLVQEVGRQWVAGCSERNRGWVQRF